MRIVGRIQLLSTSLRLLCQTFLLATVLAMASNAQATIWYVDSKNGDDSNGGYSTSDALETIGQAVTYASNGDTINVVGHGWTHEYAEKLDVQNKDNLTISAYDVGLGDPIITFSISGANEAEV